MHRQHAFILSTIAQGQTVLAYNRRTNDPKRHIKRADRVALRDGVLFVDGMNATGWTFAVKK